MTRLHFNISSIILILFSSACFNKKENKLTVLFDRVDNLKVGNTAHLKGFTIGEVTHLKLADNGVLADIEFGETIQVPVDSKFIIEPSLLGTSNITIEPSNKTTFLTSKDTARGFYLDKGLLDDVISDSARRRKIQQSLDKIGEAIKELVETARDTTHNKN